MVGYCWPDATAPSANPDTERRTIIYVVCNLLWAVGGDLIKTVDQLPPCPRSSSNRDSW